MRDVLELNRQFKILAAVLDVLVKKFAKFQPNYMTETKTAVHLAISFVFVSCRLSGTLKGPFV